MLKRTLVFTNPMNLTLKNRQLVVAYKDDPDTKQTIPIEDIAVVVSVLYADTIFEKVTRPLSVGLSQTSASLVRCYAKEQKTIEYPMMQ